MQSRYDEAEARLAVERHKSDSPPALVSQEAQRDLALRVYTSRLLGADPSLVLHGGGNTSVKTEAEDLSGEHVTCLAIKGSGWDLASIAAPGFPLCRLEALLALCRLEELSDENMVRGLRSQMLDPGSPTPSVEALLHAFLPAKFVDHTHADAVLAAVDQPDARRHAERIWGDQALFVPYIMPGFVLLRRIVELAGDLSQKKLIVLEKHGIISWGQTARESYEAMIEAVSAAERYLSDQKAALSLSPVGATPSKAEQVRLAPLIRGALGRSEEGRHFIVRWRSDPDILELLQRSDARDLVRRGPLTPDHVIRTKQRPLWFDPSAGDARGAFERALDEYQAEYRNYFERNTSRASHLERLDPLPRIVLCPGLGALSVGATARQADVVGDIYQHTAQVIRSATALGSYQPVSEAELFEVEYWSLEQAKLKKAGKPGPFTGKSVLVTGAARGIGLATALEFLARGAHVVMSDHDSAALSVAVSAAEQQYGGQLASLATDVTDPAQVDAMFEHAISSFGGVDIVVSNAGTAPSGLLHEAAGHEALERSLKVNLMGHQHVARRAAALFIEQGLGGCLLFNASKSAFNQGPEFGPYAIPKTALLALMRQYAVDLARYGVRSSAVNADRVHTDLFGGGVLETRARARGVSSEEYFRLNLLKRETLAEDVARAFCWLAEAPATTGAVIPVDGGNPAAFPR